MNERRSVAVLFGGRSVEHEISVISGLQLIAAVDPGRFDVVPVYIAPNGAWYTGEELLDRSIYKRVPAVLAELQEVTLLPRPGERGLTKLPRSASALRELISPSGGTDVIPVDVYLPVFHGQYGEDGCLQGLFELAGVPYTGSDVLSSAATMNKYLCKKFLEIHGVPVLPAYSITRADAQRDIKAVIERVTAQSELSRFPLFVKPCNLGSSIGVSRVPSVADLPAALTKVFKYDTTALVEPCITNLMEINCAVREVVRDDRLTVEPSVVEIPVSQSGVLSYEEKYLRDGGKKTGPSEGMASLTRIIDPPDLDKEIKERVMEYATRSFSLLGASGVARLDFMVDLDTGALYFNEFNSLPGSLSFYLWMRCAPRVLYSDVIDGMIESALHRHAIKASLDRSIGLKALK